LGNVYVADLTSSKIRKITTDGMVSTLAVFSSPYGLAVDALGNVYSGAAGSNLIKKVTQLGYTVSPNLPAGLSLDAATGDITGTPTTAVAAANYTITAKNTSGSSTYIINIAVLSNNAKLSALTISSGTLTPNFIETTNTYSASVLNATTSVTVTPTKSEINASIQVSVNGSSLATVISGSPSTALALNVGNNVITVKVTAQNGTTINTYNISVNREALPAISYTTPQAYIINVPITPLSPNSSGGAIPYAQVTTFAGSGVAGSTNATGISASFNNPRGVAFDVAGNAYIADAGNNKIRKISASGVVTTFAGSGALGSTNGTGVAASFNNPTGIIVDAIGNIYVSEPSSNLIRKITPAGVVTTFAGSGATGSTNATGTAASFNTPSGLAVDALNNVYVADAGNNKIRKITTAGVVTTFAGSGSQGSTDATGLAASFNIPRGVAFDASGNIYVAEQGNNKIRKITAAGVVTTFAGSGSQGSNDATGIAASFYLPFGVVLDALGNVYVADIGNYKIRKITTTGVVTTLAGSGLQGSTDATGITSSFSNPFAVALDATGNVYVVDVDNNKIRKVSVLGYKISPNLPTGLSINAITGIISGTPTTITAATNYTVTASNLSGNGTTIINIATLASNNANLSNLTISLGSLSSSFSSATTAYGVTVPNTTTSLTITPTKEEVNATIQVQVNGGGYSAVVSGVASSALAINVGINTIDVKVTAQNGTTIKIYTITVNCASQNADLSNLQMSIGNLNPVFSASILSYKVAELATTKLVTITPTKADIGATIYIQNNGGGYSAINSGTASASITIGGPETLIDIKVVAQDGVTTKTYKIGILQAPSISYAVGTSSFMVSQPITPLVATNIGGSNSSINITPNLPSGLTLYPVGYISGTPTVVSPATTYTITATNYAGSSSTTISIAVSLNNNTNLSSLIISSGALSPTFISATTAYTASVSNATSTITVTPAKEEINATIQVQINNGGYTTVNSNATSSPLALNIGNNIIDVKVTAQDGTIKIYTITVNRISNSADLSSLILSNGTLNPSFSAAVTNYTAGVLGTLNTITFTPTKSDTYSSISYQLNGGGYTSISSGSVSPSLPLGITENTIDIKVIAQDGITVKMYKLIVTRNPSISYTSSTNNFIVNQIISPISPTNVGGVTNFGQVTTFAGSGVAGTKDSTGILASFSSPYAVAVDATNNNVYVADVGNQKIRKITTTGIVTTLAGSGVQGSTNGVGTAASFSNPFGIAVDALGNVYVADIGNNKIRKITTAGVVSTFAGSGLQGSTDATGIAASFNNPFGVAVDALGNVFVADQYNNKIRKITPAGIVTTLAGSGVNGSTNGTGLAASFSNPRGLAVDALGNVYVADIGNHKIRKITPSGVVTTFAGSGLQGSKDSADILASFNFPQGITIDALNNIYVSDVGSPKIRKITADGVVTTLAGNGTSGSIDGTGITASFNNPFGVAVDALGNVFVADQYNNKIRKVGSLGYTVSPTLPSGLMLNPTTGAISGTPTIITPATSYTITASNAFGSGNTTLSIATLGSPNANLSSILLSAGASLNPFFSPTTTAYAASVSNSNTSITVTPTKSDANATIEVQINNAGYTAIASGSVSSALALNIGANTIEVKVTAQDGTIKIYTITVTRLLSSNANLSSLSISSGTLSPTFAVSVINYTTSVVNSVSSVTVTPILTPNNLLTATIEIAINGGSFSAASSGVASAALPLNVGLNTIDVKVTAENGISIKIYTINVTRLIPEPAISYGVSSRKFIIGTTISPLVPTNTGGAIASYSITPTLPTGLTFNSSTGVISGTPTVLSASTTYFITAFNAGGNNLTTIDIETAYPLPIITSVSKDSVCIGDIITVSGSNFIGITAVKVGGVPVSSFTVISTTSIQINLGKVRTGLLSLTNPSETGYSPNVLHAGGVPSFKVVPTPFQLCGGTPREINTTLFSPVFYTCTNGQSGNTIYAITPGTYTVTATDSIKCKNTASFTVTNYTSCDGYLEVKSDSAINYFGDTLHVKVKIKNGVNIFSTFGYLKFDSTYLTLFDAKVGDYLGTSIINQPPVIVDDRINFGMTKTTGQPGSNGDGTVYDFRFVLKKLPSTVAFNQWFPNTYSLPFTLSNLSVYNTLGVQPPSFNAISMFSDTTKCKYYVPVWPGDLNNDKKDNVVDLLPIGYFYGSTGPIRPEGNLQWNAQPAILWGYEIATKGSSAYKTFADGNADGIIDLADQAAIGFNLTKVHAKGAAKTSVKVIAAKAFPTNLPAVNVNMPDTLIQSTALPFTEQVNLTIGSSAYPLNNLYGVAFEIYFDPAYVNTSNIAINYAGSIFGTLNVNYTKIEDYSEINTGKLSIALTRFNTTALTANGGQVLTISFPLIATAPSGWFKVTALPIGCNDKFGNDLTITGSEDSLRINGAVANLSIAGRLKTPLAKSIKNVICNLKGISTMLSDAAGVYQFTSGIAANSNVVIKPTKNNDITKANGINTTDALFVQRHILGSPKLNSAYKIIAADVNGDKIVNATDVLRIKRLILGTDTTFTKGSGATKVDRLWEFVDSAYIFPDTTNPFPFKDSISFTNLTSNKINQTFIGVKLGDVNYDWNPAVAKGSIIDNVELIIDNAAIKVDKQLSTVNYQLPIKVKNFKDIAAMQYTLHFNNKDYEFVGIENNKLDIDFNSKQANQNGNISFLWTDKNAVERSLEDGTEIFVLVLKGKRLMASGEWETRNLQLIIDNSITEIGAWDKELNQHNIILTQKSELETQNLNDVWSVSPNPTNGEIKVSIVSKTNKTLSFEFTDAQGKAIFKQVVELQKGNNNFTMNLKKNGNLTTGVYFLKAVGIEGENVKKILVK
jgi:sugar lactone lactonase YvrE